MWNIILSVGLLPLIGLVAGIGLAIANHFMAVKENETAKKICDVLPGANCGGCGFSGCAGYAAALANSPHLKTTLCVVGGNETAKEISAILGVDAGETVKMCAVVRCAGSFDATVKTSDYTGISSCRAAAMFYNGGNGCRFGCIGLGDCVAECDKGALAVRNGVAVVDPAICIGCGKCAAVCPKKIIAVVPAGERPYVPCRNTDKGADTKKVCAAGCIGCRMCAKVCEHDAITFEGGLAVIDPAKCVGCGKCAEACKFGVIRIPRS